MMMLLFFRRSVQSLGYEIRSRGRAGSALSLSRGKNCLNYGWSTPRTRSNTTLWNVVICAPASRIAAMPTLRSCTCIEVQASTTTKTLMSRSSRSRAVYFMQMCASQPYRTTVSRASDLKCASTSGVSIENCCLPSKTRTPSWCFAFTMSLMSPNLT